MDMITSLVILAWVAIALLAFAMAGLLAQVRQLRAGGAIVPSQVGPRVGALAPSGPDLSYDQRSILVFADTNCPTCELILPEVVDLAQRSDVRFVVLFKAHGKPIRDVAMLEHQKEAFAAFDVRLTPFIVAIEQGGRIVRAEPVGSTAAFTEFVSPLLPHERGAA